MEGRVQSGVGKAREAVLKLILAFVLAVGLVPVASLAGHSEAYATESSWLWPVPSSTTINQRWNSEHGGLDIGGSSGCDIVASKSGTVYLVLSVNDAYDKNHVGYGNGVIINHGDGTYSHYAHMDSTCVKTGDHVSQGQKIGTMGKTGNATGVHLHFALKSGSQAPYGGPSGSFDNNKDVIPYIYTVGSKGNMTMPTISTSSSNYVVGETVKMTWAKTSSNTDFYQYWVVVKNATTGQQIYAGAAGSTGNVNVNSYSFKASTAGTYNLDVWAVPYNDVSSRQKHASKTITVLPADTQQPTVSNVVALTGTDGKTRLEWCESPLQSANYDSRAYKLRVFSGVVSSTTGVTPIYEEELTGLYKELDLAPGTYTAYVRARNTKYDFLYSDPVYMTFNVPGDLRTTTNVLSGVYYLRYADDTSLVAAGTTTSSGSNWASFELEEFTGADNQQLIVSANTDGSYCIKVKSTGMFLNVFSGTAEYWYGLKDDANVGQFVSNGTNEPNETWYFDQNPDGTYSLRSRHNYLYITAADDNPAAGTDLRMFGLSRLYAQKFVLEEAECHHDPSAEITESTKQPTCTEDGYWEYASYCEKCGIEMKRYKMNLPALGHEPEAIPAVEPTCTEQGSTEGSMCSRCREVFDEPQVLDALGHEWGEWVVKSEATDTADGLKVRVCARCLDIDTEAIPATGSSEPDPGMDEPTDPIEAFVYRLYKEVLGRETDPRVDDAEGYWVQVNALRNGFQPAEIAYNYFNSEEYMGKGETPEQTVERVYRVMFGRDSDEAGKAMWVGYLECGMSVRAVIQGFSQAPEYHNYFRSIGVNDTTISPATLAPRDRNVGVTQFVFRLYTIVLGRDADEVRADAAGLDVQTEAILNGVTAATIAQNVFGSQEYANRGLADPEQVRCAYMAILGRTAEATEDDVEGRTYWEGRLKSEGVLSVVYGFCQSQEFSDLCAIYGVRPR